MASCSVINRTEFDYNKNTIKAPWGPDIVAERFAVQEVGGIRYRPFDGLKVDLLGGIETSNFTEWDPKLLLNPRLFYTLGPATLHLEMDAVKNRDWDYFGLAALEFEF